MSDTQILESCKNFEIKRRRHGLYQWLEMPTQDVLDAFMTLPNAKRIGKDDEQCVFVPGTKDDRLLLIAHADTVWDKDRPFQVQYKEGIFFCPTKHIGLGADDRAGIAMLWQLRETGHSLLIPNGEEKHCLGAHALMKDPDWVKEINDNHRFAIEMDRMNDRDLAFYDVASDAFKDYCEQQFPEYKRVHGSYTDIRVLCQTLCGVNISVGYYNQHSDSEHLKTDEWEHSLNLMRKLCAKKDLPRFIQDVKPKQEQKIIQHSKREYNSFDHYQTSKNSVSQSSLMNGIEEQFCTEIDDIVVCYHCDAMMDVAEWKDNKECCLYCGKEF